MSPGATQNAGVPSSCHTVWRSSNMQVIRGVCRASHDSCVRKCRSPRTQKYRIGFSSTGGFLSFMYYLLLPFHFLLLAFYIFFKIIIYPEDLGAKSDILYGGCAIASSNSSRENGVRPIASIKASFCLPA